jgi:polyadenylate-binding protein
VISGGGGTTTVTERERMKAAVGRFQERTNSEGEMEELVELLMALPTRDRKLCLFNPQVLAAKVVEALEIIQTPDDIGPPITARNLALAVAPLSPARSSPLPTPSSVKAVAGSTASFPQSSSSPPLPSASLPSPSCPSDPPSKPKAKPISMNELIQRSAQEMVEILLDPNPSSERVVVDELQAADLLPDRATPEFGMKKQAVEDWLEAKIFCLASVHQQKQKIGEKLFKVLKSFGKLKKSTPKLTVELLDSQDLRALCLLMELFPAVLKLKVLPPSDNP